MLEGNEQFTRCLGGIFVPITLGVRMTSGRRKLLNCATTSTYMPRIAAPKATPMSRKVTQVIFHSPSHNSVGCNSSAGWPWRLIAGFGNVPRSCVLMRLSTSSIP